MTTRLMLPLLAIVTLLLAAPADGASRYRVGVGDQHATLFEQPRFLQTKVKRVRYLVPWNWRSEGWLRDDVDRYLTAARAARREVFVTFTAARGCWEDGRYSRSRACRAPSPKAYRRAFRAFRRAYPFVRTYAPWNEANHVSQPIARNPKRAAQYYNVVRSACRGCTIVAADLLDSSNMLRYVRTFRRYAKGSPRRWGLHNYSDVNRRRARGTRALLRAVPGEVWLTETGGIVRFAPDFPYSTGRAAARTRFMFSLADRYSRRRAGMRSRITRIYPYSWFGEPRGARFDAGLMNADGSPRRAYSIFRAKVRRLSK